MKEKELRELSECGLCKQKIGAGMGIIPTFAKITVEKYILNMPALQRQQGLGMMISPGLATVMGADEDLAKKIESVTFSVCPECMSIHSDIFEKEAR